MNSNFELTQSSLKDFINLPRQEWKEKWILKNRPYEFNNAFIYGSILDGLLFEPEVLKKRFITYRGKDKPSDNIQAVIGLVAKKYTKARNMHDLIVEACNELNFGNKWKRETLLKRFEGFDDYISFCMNNKHRTVVMADYAKNIQDVANYLVNHQPNRIKQFIVANPNEDYRNEFQVTLRGELHGIPCKAIIDIMHFDEVNSTARVIDFKTTYDTNNFKQSIEKYGYDTQCSFYNEIVKLNPDVYDGYTLLPPMNIAVAKRDLDIYIHNFFNPHLDACKIKWMPVVKEIADYLKTL